MRRCGWFRKNNIIEKKKDEIKLTDENIYVLNCIRKSLYAEEGKPIQLTSDSCFGIQNTILQNGILLTVYDSLPTDLQNILNCNIIWQ